ncbi:MAG: TonB-dependent receptor [Prevotellaceae bacterium]|jgi:hypothetical protein|nr:TonB-dependent receptor [Prevotellaceae bacterium]
MSKKILLVTVFLFAVVAVWTQQRDTVLVRNVEIERDYTPEIISSDRPSVAFGISEPKKDDVKANFSNYSSPLQTGKSEFVPLPYRSYFPLSNREPSKAGFLRLGVGPLFSWLADFAYPIWNTKDGYFDLFFHHDGILGAGKKPTKKLFNTGGGFNFFKNFSGNQFYLSAKYFNESFNYYGNVALDTVSFPFQADLDSLLNPKQSFNKADITLGIKSTERNDNGWLYNAYLNYHLHSTKSGIAEHNINAMTDVDLELGDNNLLVSAGIRTFFYQNKDTLPYLLLNGNNNPWNFPNIEHNSWKTNVIIDICPAYMMNFNNVKIRLGLKSFFNFGKDTPIAASPDVKIDYFLKNFLNLYAGVTGDFQINSLANITAENRYYQLDNASTQHTYTPFDIFAGFKVKVVKGLLLDASVNYKYVNNEIFYRNNILSLGGGALVGTRSAYNKVFAPQYSSGMLFNATIMASYNIKDVANIFAQLKYNGWNLKEKKDMNGTTITEIALHTPVWQANVGTSFLFGKGFFGNVNFYLASGAKTEIEPTYNAKTIINLPGIYDLNLGAGYNINKNMSLFVRANNILAVSKKLNHQLWYGYDAFGAHFLLGATVQF